MGEEGEKSRWFLLPSEAAQLLSGKNPAHFPMTVPFTPPQWTTDTSVLEGTNYGCLKPCDRTCISTEEKCSSKLIDNSAISRENDNDLFVNSSSVASGTNSGDVSFNSQKCENYEDRDLSTFQRPGTAKVVNSVTNSDAKSLEAVKCSPAKFDAENMDTRYLENGACVERNLETSTTKADSYDLTNEEKLFKNDVMIDGDSLSSEFDTGPSSTLDNEAAKIASNSTGSMSLITNASSENKVISENSDDIADSQTVCRRKPRKNKQNEVASGKPQFHHPPKNIFKPTVEVRKK